MRPILSLLIFACVLGCANVGGLFESEQTKRAREFIAVSEFESARAELRVQLHNHPDDREAKAQMLFMRLAEAGRDAAGAGCIRGGGGPSASTAADEVQKKLRLDIRKSALDAGVPTADWAEYEAVLDRAVAYGWKQHDFPPDKLAPKLVFAYCAATRSDPSGVAYLVDHLAQDESRAQAAALLFQLGDDAIPALSAVASSPENLAHDAAAEALRELRLVGLLRGLLAEHTDGVSANTVRREPSSRGSAAEFLTSLGARDDNLRLADVIAAAGSGDAQGDHKSVRLRITTVAGVDVLFVTLALPASTNTEAAQGSLQPAGIQTTFLTRAWRWGTDDWTALPIDGKPSISAPDLAVVFVRGPPIGGVTGANIGPDQLEVGVYRGLQSRTEVVDLGWLGSGERTIVAPRVDVVVYHLGAGGLERVKTLDREGNEIDADGRRVGAPDARPAVVQPTLEVHTPGEAPPEVEPEAGPGGGESVIVGGDPIILGALDKSLIDAVIARNMSQIRYCYLRGLTENPALGGKITVKFVVAKDGTVSSATTKATTMNNSGVETCINSRFLRFHFPEPKGGGIVIASYPFLFSPPG